MNTCTGRKCLAVDGLDHSEECQQDHYNAVNGIPFVELPPTCFDRAESGGRVFDNCRYIHTCKSVKLICGNNPIKQKQ